MAVCKFHCDTESTGNVHDHTMFIAIIVSTFQLCGDNLADTAVAFTCEHHRVINTIHVD